MTYNSSLMKLGSNLYNSNNQNIDWNKAVKYTEYSMGFDLITGTMSGLTNYFQTKSNYYLQTTEMYNQTIPLYQKIGAQAREQMNNQANQYLNGGIDVSQGTAFKVVSHTQEQGTMKLNEIQNNLNTNVSNMRKMSSSQATAGLMMGIAQGFNSAVNRGFDFMNMASQAGVFVRIPLILLSHPWRRGSREMESFL